MLGSRIGWGAARLEAVHLVRIGLLPHARVDCGAVLLALVAPRRLLEGSVSSIEVALLYYTRWYVSLCGHDHVDEAATTGVMSGRYLAVHPAKVLLSL